MSRSRGQFSRCSTIAALVLAETNWRSDDGRLKFCGNFKSISRDAGTSFIGLTLRSTKERDAKRGRQVCALLSSLIRSHVLGEERAVRSYRITLRDRQTRTVVGYYDGSWTTDRRRVLALRKREVA